jgi:hypothetical protein
MRADTLGSIDFGLCPGSSTSRLGNQAQKIPSRKPAARKAWASKAALTSWDEVAFKLWQGWDEEVGQLSTGHCALEAAWKLSKQDGARGEQ